MSDDELEDFYRGEVLSTIHLGKFTRAIQLEAWMEGHEWLLFPEIPREYDSDGDHIVGRAIGLYRSKSDGLVEATFPSGCDPRYVARILRKYASMLEEPHYGLGIANLSLRDDAFAMVERLGDGSLRIT